VVYPNNRTCSDSEITHFAFYRWLPILRSCAKRKGERTYFGGSICGCCLRCSCDGSRCWRGILSVHARSKEAIIGWGEQPLVMGQLFQWVVEDNLMYNAYQVPWSVIFTNRARRVWKSCFWVNRPKLMPTQVE